MNGNGHAVKLIYFTDDKRKANERQGTEVRSVRQTSRASLVFHCIVCIYNICSSHYTTQTRTKNSCRFSTPLTGAKWQMQILCLSLSVEILINRNLLVNAFFVVGYDRSCVKFLFIIWKLLLHTPIITVQPLSLAYSHTSAALLTYTKKLLKQLIITFRQSSLTDIIRKTYSRSFSETVNCHNLQWFFWTDDQKYTLKWLTILKSDTKP